MSFCAILLDDNVPPWKKKMWHYFLYLNFFFFLARDFEMISDYILLKPGISMTYVYRLAFSEAERR